MAIKMIHVSTADSHCMQCCWLLCVEAIKTQSNLRLAQKLIDMMVLALERGQYEHVGSQQLWTSHCTTVDKLQSRLDSLHIAEVGYLPACCCMLNLHSTIWWSVSVALSTLKSCSESSSSSLFGMHHQCVAPLAANSPHSGLSRAISIASSKVRLCRARSFFRVAIQWPHRSE